MGQDQAKLAISELFLIIHLLLVRIIFSPFHFIHWLLCYYFRKFPDFALYPLNLLLISLFISNNLSYPFQIILLNYSMITLAHSIKLFIILIDFHIILKFSIRLAYQC